jgi:hypothetical protein
MRTTICRWQERSSVRFKVPFLLQSLCSKDADAEEGREIPASVATLGSTSKQAPDCIHYVSRSDQKVPVGCDRTEGEVLTTTGVHDGCQASRSKHGLSVDLIRQFNSLADAFASKQIRRAFLQ